MCLFMKKIFKLSRCKHLMACYIAFFKAKYSFHFLLFIPFLLYAIFPKKKKKNDEIKKIHIFAFRINLNCFNSLLFSSLFSDFHF